KTTRQRSRNVSEDVDLDPGIRRRRCSGLWLGDEMSAGRSHEAEASAVWKLVIPDNPAGIVDYQSIFPGGEHNVAWRRIRTAGSICWNIPRQCVSRDLHRITDRISS